MALSASSLPLLLLTRALLLHLLHKEALNPGLATIGNGPNPLATMTEPIRIIPLGWYIDPSRKTTIIRKPKIMASGHITPWQIDGEKLETVTDFIFLGSKITADGNCSLEIKRRLLFGRKAMTNLDSVLKSRDITLMTKVHSQSYSFPSNHVQMWELDHKEGWALKNWCFRIVLGKTLERHLGCKEIQPVHPKGNQLWIFLGRIDAKAEVPILWPPDAKSWPIWEDPDAGKIEGRRKRG